MPQGLRIDPKILLSAIFRPAVISWNRLEGRPRREDFDRSLKAEVRDALWMLSRQWQFGEFLAADGGSAVKARVQVEAARLGRYAARQGPATGYDDNLPLETMVEREPLPMDLTARARIGTHWLRLLAEHTGGDHRGTYVGEFGFVEPTDAEEIARLRSDQRAAQTHAALRRRMVDGGRLLDAIRDGRHDAFVVAAIPSGDRAGAITAAELLAEWFERVYSQPGTESEDAWAPSYLEYQFACAAPAGSPGARTVLTAEQYHHGHLDWYSFDVGDDSGGSFDDTPAGEEGGSFERAAPVAFSPSPVEFGGMPNVRWWELEDHQTELGDLRASTTDLALLMLAEFGLAYANDWSVVPYDLEVGSIADILGVVVTDVFGVRTLVRAAGRGADEDWQRWGMYNLSRAGAGGAADTRLFVPPALGKIDESAPVERVVLARDEMANMVWGVEDVIPGIAGRGVNGYEAATDLIRHLTSALGAEPPAPGTDLAYRLRTTVAENWIPFVAVHRPDSRRRIRLQRAAMPRLADASNAPVRPRGAILAPGLGTDPAEPYFVHNEEVPKAGAVVTRSFQRARWWDGRVYTWLGRRKQTGRGQGSSGLEFDELTPGSSD